MPATFASLIADLDSIEEWAIADADDWVIEARIPDTTLSYRIDVNSDDGEVVLQLVRSFVSADCEYPTVLVDFKILPCEPGYQDLKSIWDRERELQQDEEAGQFHEIVRQHLINNSWCTCDHREGLHKPGRGCVIADCSCAYQGQL